MQKEGIVTVSRGVFSKRKEKWMEVWPGCVRLFKFDHKRVRTTTSASIASDQDGAEAVKIAVRRPPLHTHSKRMLLKNATFVPHTNHIVITIPTRRLGRAPVTIEIRPRGLHSPAQAEEFVQAWMAVLQDAKQKQLEEIEDLNVHLWNELDMLTSKLENKLKTAHASSSTDHVEAIVRTAKFALAQNSVKVVRNKRVIRYNASPEALLATTGANMNIAGKSLVVLGSINMDLVAEVDRVTSDLVGKTKAGLKFSFSNGGKGANECVSLSRLGLDVTMVGKVGKDEFGTMLITQLDKEGVETAFVTRHDDSSTGVGVILKGKEDPSRITIGCSGANQFVHHTDIENLMHSSNSGLVLQLEVPLKTCEMAAEIAKDHERPVFLKASPLFSITGLSEKLLRATDVLFCNETETPWLLRLCAEKLKPEAPAATAVGSTATAGAMATSADPKPGTLRRKVTKGQNKRKTLPGGNVKQDTTGVPLMDHALITKQALNNLSEAFDAALCIMAWLEDLKVVVVTSLAGHVCLTRKQGSSGMMGAVSDAIKDMMANNRTQEPSDFDVVVMPMMEAQVLDVIGAADCLFGGFIAAHTLGLPPYLSMVWSQTCACVSTMGLGAQESCPTLENLARGMEAFAPNATQWAAQATPDWDEKLMVSVLYGNAKELEEHLSRARKAAASAAASSSSLHLAKVAAVHAKNVLGFTLLHIAALTANAATCRVLLTFGADPLAKDNFGFTPLQRAVVHLRRIKNQLKAPTTPVLEVLLAACLIRAPQLYSPGESTHTMLDDMLEPIKYPPRKSFQSQDAFVPNTLTSERLGLDLPFSDWAQYRQLCPAFRFVDLPKPGSSAEDTLAALQVARAETLRGALTHTATDLRLFAGAMFEQLVRSLTPKALADTLLAYKIDGQDRDTPPNLLSAAAFAKQARLLHMLKPHCAHLALLTHGQRVRTPLHYAALSDDVLTCLELMRWGFDFDTPDENQDTPVSLLKDAAKRDELRKHGRIRDVFISYSHKDYSAPFSKRLRDQLIEGGVTVWIDHEIQGGQEWRNAIGKAVNSCTVVIVVVAEKWAESGWCVGELKLARDKAKPILFVFPPHIPPNVTMESIRNLPGLVETLNALDVLQSVDYRVNPGTTQVSDADFLRLTQDMTQILRGAIAKAEALASPLSPVASPTIRGIELPPMDGPRKHSSIVSMHLDENLLLEDAPEMDTGFVLVLCGEEQSTVSNAVFKFLGERHMLRVVYACPKTDLPTIDVLIASKNCHLILVTLGAGDKPSNTEQIWLSTVLTTAHEADVLQKIIVLPFSPTPNCNNAMQYAYNALNISPTTENVVPWITKDGSPGANFAQGIVDRVAKDLKQAADAAASAATVNAVTASA